MTLEKMRGPYRKLRRRLDRAGFKLMYAEGDVETFEKFDKTGTKPEGKMLYLVRTRGDWCVILKSRPHPHV